MFTGIRVAAVTVAVLAAGSAAAEPPPWADALHAFLKDREAHGFAGAVLVDQGGEVVFAQGYGLANREQEIPWTTETVTTVGSITKPITGSAIVKLHVEGALSVDDPLGRWIPDLPEDKASITLHQLLTHSAGVPDIFGGDFLKDSTREWFLDRFRECDLLWSAEERGRRYQYSNAGYTLLAIVIEEASGTPYEEYLHKTFFEPLGMTNTGYTIPDWKPEQFAHGYRRDQDWGVVALKHVLPDGPSWNLRGNGGIHSTLEDMRKWHRAMIEYRVFTPEMIQLIETPYVREGEDSAGFYGYGWALARTRHGERLVWHNGGNGIFFAEMRRYVGEDTLVEIATNVAERPGDRFMGRIVEFVFEGE